MSKKPETKETLELLVSSLELVLPDETKWAIQRLRAGNINGAIEMLKQLQDHAASFAQRIESLKGAR